MKFALHYLGATVVGFLTGGIVIALVEGISSIVYPPPEGVDLSDPEQMAQFVDSLPWTAFLFVLVAWSAGSAVAAAVARRLAPNRSVRPAVIASGLLLVGALITLTTIPHPLWFWLAGIAAIPVFGVIGLGLVGGGPSALTVRTTRQIRAPIERVFATIANVSEFSDAVPGIVKIEFLTEQQYGKGTRFRETRLMREKECFTELEVTELVENKRIRMIADAGGTIWDTLFSVEQQDEYVLMDMVMDARPYRLSSRLMTPMILPMVSKAIENDMDAVQGYCEEVDSM